MVVTSASAGSPAESAGLKPGDLILDTTPKTLNDQLSAKGPGDAIKLRILRGGAPQELEIVLGKNMKREFRFRPAAQASALETAILNDWLP